MSAQTPAAEEAPAPVESAPGVAEPALPAEPAPAAEPPPAPEPAPAPAAAPVVRPYAWIKPTVIFTSAPVESFSQPNAIAGTAAGNPVLRSLDEAALTFQAQQSRAGVWFNDKAPVRGQLEFDFVDFGRSSPTTASLPRLRIAKVEWELTDSLLLVAGQDWDLFQPVNPASFDIVSVAFQAGNTAFMRQQAKFIYTGEGLELAAAVGLATNNNTPRPLLPEYNLPTLALRAALLLGPMGRVGVSAIATNWRFAAGADNERKALAGGAGIYGDITPASGLNLRFEAYGGRNLGNLATLSLGTGNATNNIDEAGGFLSAKYSLAEQHAVYALGGLAMVLNDEDVLPSYAYAGAMPGDDPAPASAALAGTGAGIEQNITARLGYEYKYNKMITFVLEGFMFQTEHVLNQTFDADLDGKQTALGSEVGLFFTF